MVLTKQVKNRLHENIVSQRLSLVSALNRIDSSIKLLAPYGVDTSELSTQHKQISTMISELEQIEISIKEC